MQDSQTTISTEADLYQIKARLLCSSLAICHIGVIRLARMLRNNPSLLQNNRWRTGIGYALGTLVRIANDVTTLHPAEADNATHERLLLAQHGKRRSGLSYSAQSCRPVERMG